VIFENLGGSEAETCGKASFQQVCVLCLHFPLYCRRGFCAPCFPKLQQLRHRDNVAVASGDKNVHVLSLLVLENLGDSEAVTCTKASFHSFEFCVLAFHFHVNRHRCPQY
jgi:hypothetical protein